ncbi:MAG: glycosyltransferase [Lachnobacterium sp.]|nr:glycosyltransferase [Lachnobacterium sp.]
MKILQIVRSMNIGGLENYVKNLMKYLLSRGCQCECLVCDNKISDYEDILIDMGIHIYHIPAPNKTKMELYNNITSFISKNKEYDIIHCHMAGSNGVLAKAARVGGAENIICHSHGVSLNQHENIKMMIYMRIMQHLMKNNAKAYIACSEAAGEYLYGQNLFKKRGIVIENGIQLEKYTFCVQDRIECRKEYNIKDADFVLGHTGSLSTVKNQEAIIEIVSALKKVYPTVKAILVGGGDKDKFLRSKAVQLGVENNIIFTGKQNNVEKYLSAMDIFIFPSKSEGFGLSLLEAQANGLPCIVSDKIQPEVKISENIWTVGLDDSIQNWLNAVDCAMKAGRVANSTEVIRKAGLDDKSCYERVLEVYKGVMKNDAL